MKQIPIYHVDAFTNAIFAGNPAAVCVLEKWLPENILQKIAIENNLPVTAFLVRLDERFQVRWFTPEYELDLCGHGSLAAAYIIFNQLEPRLQTVDLCYPTGVLNVTRNEELITLNFPAKEVEDFLLPEIVTKGLGGQPKEIYQYKTERLLVVYETDEQIRQLKPDMAVLKQIEHRGIIVTAPGKNSDFVSRTFYPKKAIFEDAVTGASHCLLVPYWSKRLNKKKLHSYQVSSRGGELYCEDQGAQILISGKAILYLQGTINLNITT